MIPLKNTILVFLLAVVCFTLLPGARAVSPAPDGGYPGFNTAEGDHALFLLFGGFGNTGVGWRSGFSAVGANFNTGVGAGTLVLNTADSNTAVGAAALLLNTTGPLNTAVGTSALSHNDTGDSNTAVGAFALSNNAGGAISNNAIGRGALFGNTSGSFNEALGVNALGANTTSNQNVAIGDDALFAYTGPGTNAGGNTAVGGGALSALTTGTLNAALGFAAGSADTGGETNNIYIGDMGAPFDANIIAIGNIPATGSDYLLCIIGNSSTLVRMPGIVPGVLTNNQDVGVDAFGNLGTFTSSARFKEDIKPMDKASEAIFALKPVTFRYKKEFDPAEAEQFGLIAEDVAKVNPACVALDREGKPISVNYRPVTAMLLNEFLKEHTKVEEQQARIADLDSRVAKQEATIAQQQKGMEVLRAQLKEQAAQIQKVSAQLELRKPAPQTVNNP